MLPGVVKTASSYLLHQAGLDKWNRFARRRRFPVVLAYHRVVEDFRAAAEDSIPSLLVSSRMFEQHLDLVTRQYEVISAEQAADIVETGRQYKRPTAMVTFDDGYRDVYENAFPILRRKGLPSTLFVITDLVGTVKAPLHDLLYRLVKRLYLHNSPVVGRLPKLLSEAGVAESDVLKIVEQSKDAYSTTRVLLVSLPQKAVLRLLAAMERYAPYARTHQDGPVAVTWDMLREMANSGVTIGSHTKSHAVLPNESAERVAEELMCSRQVLQSKLGIPVRYLAYPDGRFDCNTLLAALSAGYRCAFTTCRHQDPGHPQLTVPRTVLWENSWLDFRSKLSESIMTCQLNGLFDVVARCTQDHRLPADRLASNFEVQHAEQ